MPLSNQEVKITCRRHLESEDTVVGAKNMLQSGYHAAECKFYTKSEMGHLNQNRQGSHRPQEDARPVMCIYVERGNVSKPSIAVATPNSSLAQVSQSFLGIRRAPRPPHAN
jgi:hypothetical protein